jgi:FkbM family methyltransferase
MLRVVMGQDALLFDLKEAPRVIVDAGANVGYFALWFARKFPGAKIISIEPEASNFAMLQKNTAHLPNVTPVNAALWWKSEMLRIRNPAAANASFQMTSDTAASEHEVRAVTLPELIAQHGEIDFLKIDIEGAELPLFQNGAEAWLPHVGVLAVEPHERHAAGCIDAIRKAVGPLAKSERELDEYLVFDLKGVIR